MVDLDPLLAHLHLRSSGTWPTFARAIESFDSSIDARVCARMLSEQSLVEFDFDGARNWCVTTAQLVEYENGTVAGWGGTIRGLTGENINVTPGVRNVRIGPIDATYTHALRVAKVGDAWPAHLEPWMGKEIVPYVPSIRSIVESADVVELADRRAISERGTERFRFRFENRADAATNDQYPVLSGVWESAPRISADSDDLWRSPRDGIVVTRGGVARRVALRVGLWSQLAIAVAQLRTDRPIHYNRSELNVSQFPQLPLTYVRLLFLSGAREYRSQRYGRRTFVNVGADLNQWLCEHLGYGTRYVGTGDAA